MAPSSYWSTTLRLMQEVAHTLILHHLGTTHVTHGPGIVWTYWHITIRCRSILKYSEQGQHASVLSGKARLNDYQ